MKILVPTDGSEFSACAMDKACELAKTAKKASIKVVTIYEPQIPMAAEPFAISAEYYYQLDDLAKARASEAADAAAARIEKNCVGAEVSTHVDVGRPAEMIIKAANEWKPDVIVMGSHGRGFWGRLTLGSVSDAVVHHAGCSVMIVKSKGLE